MQKNKLFYLSLIIIYLLVLSKDTLISLFSSSIYLENLKESYYEGEYNNLSKMLDIKTSNYNITYSKIIMRDIYDFYNIITLDKGLNDNINKGNIVVNESGVIGLVTSVSKSSSEVSLLTNNKIKLSVKINNSYGILTSKDNKIIVENIKSQEEIKENDLVYTSGLTLIKEGLLIGKVTKIKKDNLDLEYILEITPSVNFNDIHYVGVIS